MKYNPCFGCNEREIGCHGRCEKYKAWDAAHQERVNIINENRKLLDTTHKRKIRGRLVDSF